MENTPSKKLYSIKEVATMYGISQWLIYHHIKLDPTFPSVNVGVKKKFLIEIAQLDAWIHKRSKKQVEKNFNLPTVEELLGGTC
jgi:predicted DNA-binding transcriptional regulator AlpA